MTRKAWLVCSLFKDKNECHEDRPQKDDPRWGKASLPTRGEVYWVKTASADIHLAFFLGAPSNQFHPWYNFHKNEPILDVDKFISAKKKESDDT